MSCSNNITNKNNQNDEQFYDAIDDDEIFYN